MVFKLYLQTKTKIHGMKTNEDESEQAEKEEVENKKETYKIKKQ